MWLETIVDQKIKFDSFLFFSFSVPFALEQEECLFRPSICKELDSNAFCNAEENVCACAPRYHRLGETCGKTQIFLNCSIFVSFGLVKAVESRCIRDIDCGGNQVCKGQRCQCNARQRRRQTTDVYGRRIDQCVNGNDETKIPSSIDFHFLFRCRFERNFTIYFHFAAFCLVYFYLTALPLISLCFL